MTASRKTTSKAPDKTESQTEDKAATAAAAASDSDASSKDERSKYAKAAADLADTVTKIVEDAREQLTKAVEDVDGVQSHEPTAADTQIADAVRRIPMATGDVHDALDALRHAAAEVARRAVG